MYGLLFVRVENIDHLSTIAKSRDVSILSEASSAVAAPTFSEFPARVSRSLRFPVGCPDSHTSAREAARANKGFCDSIPNASVTRARARVDVRQLCSFHKTKTTSYTYIYIAISNLGNARARRQLWVLPRVVCAFAYRKEEKRQPRLISPRWRRNRRLPPKPGRLPKISLEIATAHFYASLSSRLEQRPRWCFAMARAER